MRVGLAFNSYSYHENPGKIILMNNQNRLICADLRNTKTEEAFPPRYFAGASQCYYQNMPAGKYIFTDYVMRGEWEGYRVFFITLYNTLRFTEKNI